MADQFAYLEDPICQDLIREMEVKRQEGEDTQRLSNKIGERIAELNGCQVGWIPDDNQNFYSEGCTEDL